MAPTTETTLRCGWELLSGAVTDKPNNGPTSRYSQFGIRRQPKHHLIQGAGALVKLNGDWSLGYKYG